MGAKDPAPESVCVGTQVVRPRKTNVILFFSWGRARSKRLDAVPGLKNPLFFSSVFL